MLIIPVRSFGFESLHKLMRFIANICRRCFVEFALNPIGKDIEVNKIVINVSKPESKSFSIGS